MHTHTNIAAGEFKAKCLQLMDEVYEKHTEIVVTKRGKPIAKLVPLDEKPIDIFGCMKNTVTINDDIIKPLNVKWEVNEE